MKNFNRIGMMVVLGSALSLFSVSAQTINQRRENQQDRIAQGVKSGQLTAGETARLETRESHLNREIKDDREDHNGHLTPAEKRQVNRQQNRMSRSIYRDKHNGRTQ